MVKLLRISVSIFSFGFLICSKLSAQPEQEIDFSYGNDLVRVFESGLPLKPSYGFENSLIDFGRSKVRVILTDNVNFSFETDSGKIRVLGEGKVSYLNFVSSRMNLDALSETAIPYINMIGGDVVKFNNYIEAVKSNPVAHDQKFVIERQIGDVTLGLSFLKTYDSQKPLRLDVGLFWLETAKETKIRQKPIEPPEGWSWADEIPNDKISDASTPIANLEGKESNLDVVEETESPDGRDLLTYEAEPDEKQDDPTRLYIIGLVVLAIGVGFWMLRRKA